MSFNVKKDMIRRKPDITSLVYGKIPPQCNEIEEAVLGAVMLEREALQDVLDVIPWPECFYVDAHQKIYHACKSLILSGSPVDMLTVTEQLRKTDELEIVGGAYFLTRLTMAVVSSAHVVSHARIVMEKFMQRELIRISGQIISKAYEDATDVFELIAEAATDINELIPTQGGVPKTMRKIGMEAMEEIEEQRRRGERLTGISTGFDSMDKVTDGWQETDLVILGARPGTGKTALALMWAMNAALTAPGAIYSLEMGDKQLIKRSMASREKITHTKIRRSYQMDDAEMATLLEIAKNLPSNVFVQDTAQLSIQSLGASLRRLVKKFGVKWAIIDYMQLMQGTKMPGQNREQQVAGISRDLKTLAKELNITIIALSQLNREVESRGDGVPKISDLRESGAIEQDADMIMLLWSPDEKTIQEFQQKGASTGNVHCKLAKYRAGAGTVFEFDFNKEFQSFKEHKPPETMTIPFTPPDNPFKGMPTKPNDLPF